MSNANKTLLNARVRLSTGTTTFINKINANGYGIDAKGPQISVKRLVIAGKMLKELAEPLPQGEYVVLNGVTVKLNKRQQRELAEKTLDTKALLPDLSKLTYVDPQTGKVTDAKVKQPKAGAKASLKATREHNKEPKRSRKQHKAETNDLKDSLDIIDERKSPKASLIERLDAAIAEAKTKARRKLLAETFDMDWADIKKHGGAGIVKQHGRKNAQKFIDRQTVQVDSTTFIKQMPAPLKRLIQDTELRLNQKQIEQVLGALGLDTQFYAVAVQELLGKLKLSIGGRVIEGEVVRKENTPKPKRFVHAEARYADKKEAKRRVSKMKYALLIPPTKGLPALRIHQAEAKQSLAVLLHLKPGNIKRGLLAYDNKGREYMYVACDMTGPVFIDKDSNELAFTYANLIDNFKLKAQPVSELDVAV
ncbi:hypothetical protein pEaSNUABM21_00322 [Erwinia phage pEa_SNUABM_21]|nr:hypothetical protein pEaSNUABM21_00322 [Erwinia phage pEa_SNUABM_21]